MTSTYVGHGVHLCGSRYTLRDDTCSPVMGLGLLQTATFIIDAVARYFETRVSINTSIIEKLAVPARFHPLLGSFWSKRNVI